VGYPALALLSLVCAAATARPTLDPEAAGRLADAFRQWLDAWEGLHTPGERDRAAAEQALASATHAITLTANYRVLRSLKAARAQDLSAGSVAQLLIEMRRNLRRPGILRAADLEVLLAPRPRGLNGRGAAAPAATSPASFLS
jgi:hypothetical protein